MQKEDGARSLCYATSKSKIVQLPKALPKPNQFDRFTRNHYDSATYKARLKKNGVRVLSARENISDNVIGMLMEAVLEVMAEYYSDK